MNANVDSHRPLTVKLEFIRYDCQLMEFITRRSCVVWCTLSLLAKSVPDSLPTLRWPGATAKLEVYYPNL